MSILQITRGSTYCDSLQWSTDECVFRPIKIVRSTAPVRLDCPGHGVPDDWEVSIEGHANIDPRKIFNVRRIDDDTLEIPCLNGTMFSASPAVLRYLMPVDLTGYEARLQIRDRVGGNLLLELSSNAGAGITIDHQLKQIKREIAADITAALTWKRAVYGMEMILGSYVIKLDSGTVEVSDEVTT